MKKNNTKIKPSFKEDWWIFCEGYLKMAELACREMVHQKYLMFENRVCDRKAFWISDLYIPMVYNLKHSIEIFLKYFYIIILEEIPVIDKDGHNIEKFLNIFKNHCNLDKINKVIKNAFKNKKKSIYSLNVADLETEFSKEWLENIAKITLKYFYCEDIRNKLSVLELVDISNDGFRYPKNKLKININYLELINKIKKEDVEIVLKDIYELQNAFYSLRFLINIYHDIEK